MSHVTESLCRAILNGAGVTRNEVEQLARHFLDSSAALRRLQAAALAASKGTPDSDHPRSRETAAESLSVDTSVAERKDAARGRYLIRALHCDDFLNHFGCYTNSIATREKLVDAAMSADVRSQAKEPGCSCPYYKEPHGEVAEPTKPDPLDEPCPKCKQIPGMPCRDEVGRSTAPHSSRIRKANGRARK